MTTAAETASALALIGRGSTGLITEKELCQRLERGRPLRVKLGVDPTAPDIHLGHTVLLTKLRVFQDLGHQVVFIIGDFTARIGDPSGRSATRPLMTEDEIMRNAATYQEQVFRILDRSRTEVVYNSSWLVPLGIDGLLRLAAGHTVARMLERDDFEERYKGGTPISLVEFLYPLLQAYDSVAVRSDIELGGNDQKFNLLLGREMQRDHGQEPQMVLTMPLLEGTDGVRKMSKSYGNYIALNDTPADMFGKIMSVSDELMFKYYELLTLEDLAVVKALHPRAAKERLARQITERYHGPAAAATACEQFACVFTRGALPENMQEHCMPACEILFSDLLLAAHLVPSRKEARRLMEQGGIRVNGEQVREDRAITIAGECVIQVGKRTFKKIRAT